jgi:hypothetical protein
MAASSGWSEPALNTVYRRGLNRELQTELACRGDLTDLNQYIRMSISISNLLVDRRPIQLPMACESVTRMTNSITLQIGLLHSEVIQLMLLSSPKEPLILSHPWLSLDNPAISWRAKGNCCHGLSPVLRTESVYPVEQPLEKDRGLPFQPTSHLYMPSF